MTRTISRREPVLHGKGRPSPVFMEFLCRLSPYGALVGDFVADLTAFAGRTITARDVKDLAVEACERGYQVETKTTMGVTRVFAPSHAMLTIRSDGQHWLERRGEA